jgi:3-oxocholest-4-en-26-oate---CoA ligase
VEFNLADLWECVAGVAGSRLALVAGPIRLTYAELDERATRLAHGLASLGVGAGDHVGLLLPNCAEHVECLLACFKLRAVPINVNYRYTAAEVAYVLSDAEVVGVVTAPSLAGVVPGGPWWVVPTGPPYAALVSSGSAASDFGPRSADDHYILYTGGTTGRPKGVVWRQEDIFFATLGGGNPGGPSISSPSEIASTVVTNRAQRLGPFLPPGDPGPSQFVSLALGPLMHASGQWSCLGALLAGATCVLYVGSTMDMRAVLELVAAEQVCMLTLVGDTSGRPLALELEAGGGAYDTSSIRLMGSGGSILSAGVKARLLAAVPTLLGFTEAIGSSEAPVQGVALGSGSSMLFAARPDTAVFDAALQRVVPGSGVVGRLATRGRLPIGYWNDPGETSSRFVTVDGTRWVMPGDMATVEADGTVRLLGRGSMCINTGGEKVYPEEVEAVVKGLPDVIDAVVVGVPDERWGERVVVVCAGSVTLDAVQTHCRGVLAGYKVPRDLVVVDEVRRSPAGKPDYPWARSVALGRG